MPRCTVFSADRIPIRVTPIRKAIKKIFMGKYEVLESYEGITYRSENQEINVPKTVAVTRYVKLPDHFYGSAPLTSKNLRLRDDNKCQYCSRKEAQLDKGEYMTRDHILPRSKGGKDVWTNVVLACNSCNNRKADQTPEDAEMPLLNQPYAPTRLILGSIEKGGR